MSKSVKKEIPASEYSSEQVLAVNTNDYHYTVDWPKSNGVTTVSNDYALSIPPVLF